MYPSMHWAEGVVCMPACTGQEGGVCPGGVCPGGCLPKEVFAQGVSAQGGGQSAPVYAGIHPRCEQNDRRLSKYYLEDGNNSVITRNRSGSIIIDYDIQIMATPETKVDDVHDTMKAAIVQNNATLTSRVSLDPPDMVHLVFGENFHRLDCLIVNI